MWTNSACTSGSWKELTLSTSAGGKVDSIPKMIPIFFTAGSLEAKLGQRRPKTDAEGRLKQPNSKAFSRLTAVFGYSRYILAMGRHQGQSWKLRSPHT